MTMAEATRRLFVGNLPNGVADAEVRRAFEKFGLVASLELKTKKAADGEVLSTFAFVDLTASDKQLSKCVQCTDGSTINGSRIRVQQAKENFLDKLKSERAARSGQLQKVDERASQKMVDPYGQHQKRPEPRGQLQKRPGKETDSYDPLKMFQGRPKKAAEEEPDPVSSNEFQPHSEELVSSNGGVLTRLEGFSGMWKDQDEAPVVVERRPKAAAVVGQQAETATVPVVEARKEKSKSAVVLERDPKKEADNEKRVRSLRQRNETLKARQDAIKSALSLKEGAKNRKVFFDDGDDVDDSGDHGHGRRPPQPAPAKTRSTGPKLFDDDDDDDEAGEVEDQDQFQLRPHLEGRSGQQLLELQSRFGHDARFKMDGRFAENDASEDDEDGGQDADVGEDDDADADAAAETDRQMAILSSLVPMAPPSLSRKAKTVESTAFVRFDPTLKEHSRFEKPATATPASAASASASVGRKGRAAAAPDPAASAPLPEVSAARYYTTATQLQIGANQTSGFSLRSLFQTPVAAVAEAEAEAEAEPEAVETPPPPPPPEAAAAGERARRHETQSAGYWKNAGMWHESLFLHAEDARCREAIEFLQREAMEAAYADRAQWAGERDRLIRFYKNKMRRADGHASSSSTSTSAGQLRRRLPPDQADQADHFYGGQVAAAAAAKKPRRTFYHRSRGPQSDHRP